MLTFKFIIYLISIGYFLTYYIIIFYYLDYMTKFKTLNE